MISCSCNKFLNKFLKDNPINLLFIRSFSLTLKFILIINVVIDIEINSNSPKRIIKIKDMLESLSNCLSEEINKNKDELVNTEDKNNVMNIGML
ncbi:hypothetical protein [Mesoplasma entomophilum]|uniref:hypothetical protein n=1 Tax=Mesoplasma entomophilum TaxID=2149 RepID=UPI001F146606|nr:hypothetical protein [Mesoplasma entomophilum]